MQNYSNFSNISVYSFDKEEIADKFLTNLEVLLLIIVFIFTIIGNIGVILILLVFKHGHNFHSFKSHNHAKDTSKKRPKIYSSFSNVSRMSFYIIQ